MNIKYALCCVSVVCLSNVVYALETRNYIIIKLGETINAVPKILSPQLQSTVPKYDKYPSMSIGIGRDLREHVGFEASISHSKYSINKNFSNVISTTNLHLGIVYKFFNYKFTPYGMIGGGLSFNKIGSLETGNYNYPKYNDFFPSYYVGGGMQYKCLEHLYFDASYKYTYQGSIKGSKNEYITMLNTNQNRIKFKMNSSEILLGIKVFL